MRDLLFSGRAKARIHRRLFLKALALGLSAPVAYRLIEQATAAPTGAPQRFMLFFMPHGVPPEHYNPVGDAENFSLIDSGVSILGPLDPYKSLVNIYQGFTYPGANTHEGITKFLSNTDFADSDDTTPRTSIEHYIGSELGTGTLALGAVPHREWGQDLDAKLMWDGQPVVPQKNPLVAYDEVFGGLAMGDAPAAPPAANDELYEALLTLTERDIEGLSQSLSGMTGEQSKLAIHLDSIKALRSNGGGGISCDTAPTLAALDALRAKASGQADKWFLTEENFPDIFAAQLEIAAAAMVCNARPVTAIQPLYANCEMDFGFMGSSGGHHSGLSHTMWNISNGVANMTTREPFAKAQRWFIEQLVTHCIAHLDVPDPADPGKTVLDNTIILMCSEIGEGQDHNSFSKELLSGPPPGVMSYMPLVTIGGGAGALKTGQRLNYHDPLAGSNGAGDRQASDLWLTLAQAMGIPTMSFGGSSNPIVEALS